MKKIKKYLNGDKIVQEQNNGFNSPVFFTDPNIMKQVSYEPEGRNRFMEGLADFGKGALSIGSIAANFIPGVGQAVSAGLSGLNSAIGLTRNQKIAIQRGGNDILGDFTDMSNKIINKQMDRNVEKKKAGLGQGVDGGGKYDFEQANGGMLSGIPIQAEKNENFILPNGNVYQSNANMMHEQMSPNEVTDILPENSYGTSVRNKMSLKELSPYLDEKTLPMFQEIYKKLGKKQISPNDISELGRKTQKNPTPNSFKTDELNKTSKDVYSQLAMHMNEIINIGKKVQEQMKNGGMVKKYGDGDMTKLDWGNMNNSFTPLLNNTYYNLDRKIAKHIGADMHSYDGHVSKEWANKVANFYSQIPGSSYYNHSTDLNIDKFGTIMNNEILAQNSNPNWLKEWDGPVIRNADNTFTFPNRIKPLNSWTNGLTTGEGVNAGTIVNDIQDPLSPYKEQNNIETGGKKKRFKFGNDEMLLGVQGLSNLYAKNSAMKQTPNHAMETPSTYISTMKTELPIGNDLYNIEKSGKNSNQFLRDNTNSYSLLAGNVANNNATTLNKIGDYLTDVNRQNVGLYNSQQNALQGLLGSNMNIQNQNATDQNDMANYKRMLDSEMWTKNVDKFGNYVKTKNQNSQMQDNTKMALIHLLGAYPDLANNPAIANILKNYI